MVKSVFSFINDHFGSKRGLLETIKYRVLLSLGYFKDCQRIDFNNVHRLVFVCYGNICRSAFAEYYARSKGLNAISFGLHCKGSRSADPRAIAIAKQQGIDMEKHVTTNISQYQAEAGDLVIVMEPRHLVELKQAIGDVEQLTIAPLWKPWRSPYLHDPYNSTPEFFQKCITDLVASILTMKEKFSLNQSPKSG